MPLRNRLWLFLGAGLTFLVLLALFLFLWTPAAPEPDFLTRSGPNGYDLYLQAAEALEGEPAELLTQSEAILRDDPGALSAFLEKNQEALRLWRQAIPLPAEAPRPWYTSQFPIDHLGLFKKLAAAAQVAALQAESERNFTDAAQIYLDVIRTGQDLEHGTVICLLVGISIEGIALSRLGTLAPSLPPEVRRQTAATLRELNNQRISLDEVFRREQYYVQKNWSFAQQLVHRFHPITRNSRQKISGKYAALAQKMTATANSLSPSHPTKLQESM